MLALPSTLTTRSKGEPVFDRFDEGVEPGVTLGRVTHVFTHFRLTFDVVAATLAPGCVLPPAARWCPVAELASAGLPTVFRKAVACAIEGETKQ